MADNSSVKVAVRVRPMVPSEIAKGSKNVVDVFKTHQQIRVSEKAFTFNHVFNPESNQSELYDECVKPLIPKLFEGYNVTILAYGQTGSGKTYSMGTTYNGEGEMGVIPRAINDIFSYVNDHFTHDFTVSASFMELYQEVLYDLLSTKPKDQSVVDLREDAKGICVVNLSEKPVKSVGEVLSCLEAGAVRRATSSTNMNAQSSRSHAIFTISISIQEKGSNSCKTAKFHLVDLAGSERSNKTGATGQVFKEGININKALLALGNVISALGDEKGPQSYINYRDSPLTRLLKDSLGGNSITLMIACISPADYNMDETISTLRYADRARRIKNKPLVNEDARAAEVNKLKKIIQEMQMEMMGRGGPTISTYELDSLKKDLEKSKKGEMDLQQKLHLTLTQNSSLLERLLIVQTACENISTKTQAIKGTFDHVLNELTQCITAGNVDGIQEHVEKLNGVRSEFNNLMDDQRESEEQFRSHEMNTFNSSTYLSANGSIGEGDVFEVQVSHTATQMAMNAELQELMINLMNKEELAKQIASNSAIMSDMNEVAENKAKIAALENERDQLLQQLKTKKADEGHKMRIQALEKQIQNLNKKQSDLIKSKEKNDMRVKKLSSEIQQMKAAKIQIIKKMKMESDHFRTWKTQREREISKLREQDRKKQNQILTMERIHSSQQNVLRRKVEEAAAINRRLKESLALRKKTQASKIAGKVEKLKPWIKQEFEVYVNLIEAKVSLTYLMQDREFLQGQLQKLQENPDADELEVRKLQSELDLRSSQIAEFQQKIIDHEEEEKAGSRFDTLQTMAEAKYAVSVLFELASEIKRRELERTHKTEELEQTVCELQEKCSTLEKQFTTMEKQHKEQLANIELENEEIKFILLRHSRADSMTNPENAKIEDLKQNAIEKLEAKIDMLTHENERLMKERDDLIKTLEEISEAAESADAEEPVSSSCDTENIYNGTPQNQESFLILETPKKGLNETFNISMTDDKVNDPDWLATPLGRKVRAARAAVLAIQRPPKRTASKGGCSCKGQCNTRNCGCKKLHTSCDAVCKCEAVKCRNRGARGLSDSNSEISGSLTESTVDANSNGPFKRPKLSD